MKPIVVEQSDLNSETAILVSWSVPNGATVASGETICIAETTKAAIEVPAPAAGQIFHVFAAGATIAFNRPIAYLAASSAESSAAEQAARAASAPASTSTVKATKKARQLAAQHGLSLETLAQPDVLITEAHVYAALGKTPPSATATAIIAQPSPLPATGARVLVLGAGLGAMQVIDILLHDPLLTPVACLDDDVSTHGQSLFGIPVWGALAQLDTLWSAQKFTHAIVAISTNIAVRKNLFLRARALGIPFVNAIDPTARLNRGVVLGTGNVLCSQVHVGVATVLGDNNFISSHTSIEHHNTWGSHNTVGPACATSSRAVVGDEVLFGTGIFLQPGVGIGSRARIASGAVLTQNIPADHAVKMHAQFQVTPIVPTP
ncbi:MAG: bifunctional N-acetylglucosamine-1-phosphate uridyltransferase/glucosamine-1-phosphate acetyltransferase [Undibacterium sp.]|nr:bifunctional N-acetylglucosamine-1-phosphate uridyltransferase/glucosamine-1-phosphate acetyltransferase [Opitutaceae bacterium]